MAAPVTCRSCGKLTPLAILCMYCGKHLEDQIACPKCSRKLIAGSKSCQYCGAAIVAQPPPDMIACAKCGRKMAGHLERCQVCGTPSPRATVVRPAPAAGADPAAALIEQMNAAIQKMETDRAAEAIPVFDQLLAMPNIPERPMLMAFKTAALQRCGRAAEGLAVIQQALQLAPESATCWSYAADCFRAAGDLARAERSADKAIGYNPEDPLAWVVKGLCQKAAGRKAEALAGFERAVRAQPKMARGWAELGAVADELGQVERAADAYGRQLLGRHPGLTEENLRAAKRLAELQSGRVPLPPGLGDALADLGRERIENARFDDAGALLNVAVGLAPKNAPILATAAGAIFLKPTQTEEELRRAAQWTKQALEIDPNNAIAKEVAGFLEEDTGKKPAAPAPPKPVAPPSDVPPARAAAIEEGEKAQLLFNGGLHEKGLQGIDRALAADPTYHHAWFGKGSMLLRLKRYAEAIPCFDKAVALKADLPTPWAERANCLANVGRFAEAIESANRSLALSKDKIDALLARAGAYEQTGKLQEAMKDYSRALTLASFDDENSRGIIEFGRARLRAVVDRLRPPTPKLPPSSVGPLLDQAQDQRKRGVFQDAAATLKKATASDPFSVIAWINQASILSQLGRNDDAIQSFERAKKLKPDLPAVWMCGASVLAGAGRDADALAAAEKAAQLDPYEVMAWGNLGAMLNRAGRKEEALAALERTMLLDPFNVIGLLNYAGSLSGAGRRDEAIVAYKRFLMIAKHVRGPGIEDHVQSAEDALRKLEKPGEDGGASITIGKPIQQIGDQYDVYKVLGRGGFGIVYLAIMRKTDSPCALKTFLHEHRTDPDSIASFKREAQTWINLDRHPNIVSAYAADEVNGKLYLAIELIIPATEGMTTLQDYLEKKPPGIVQSLRWAIQFCHGMEYAHSRGIRSHRDIKPANILIDGQKRVKISDFGLATAASRAPGAVGGGAVQGGAVGLSIAEGGVAGTPTHMPPEQYQDASKCDARSDVYAFGVTLHQMAANGKVPYLAPAPRNGAPAEVNRFFSDMFRLHAQAPLPELDSPLAPVIRRCMAKDPNDRYPSFRELRADLEPLLSGLGQGETVPAPVLEKLGQGDLLNKALSLDALGSRAEALKVCEQMIAADANDAAAWGAKGLILMGLGRRPEALAAYDRSLSIDPRQASVLSNKAGLLYEMKRVPDALACVEKALEVDPQDGVAWRNKAVFLNALGRGREADAAFEQGLALSPNSAAGWINRANALCDQRKWTEAAACVEKALALDDRQPAAWQILADVHLAQNKFADALRALDRCVALNPRDAAAHSNRGGCLNQLNRRDEAAAAFQEALRIDPGLAMAWNNLGDHHKAAGRPKEALEHFNKALAIDPNLVLSLWGKASVLRMLDRAAEALPVLDRALSAGADPIVTTYLKGECHQKLKQLEPALTCYQKVVESPKAGQSLVALGLLRSSECCRMLGGVEQATQFLTMASQLAPEHPEVRQALVEHHLPLPSPGMKHFAKANELLDRMKAAEALVELDLALKADPTLMPAWCDLSVAYGMLKRYPESLAAAMKAIELDPKSHQAWMNRAIAEEGVGRPADALKSYQRFLQVAPSAAAGQVANARKRIAALGGR